MSYHAVRLLMLFAGLFYIGVGCGLYLHAYLQIADGNYGHALFDGILFFLLFLLSSHLIEASEFLSKEK